LPFSGWAFKHFARARMEKTGERYAAARAALLSAEETKATEGPTLTMSERWDCRHRAIDSETR
jgi:hypothetical protein